MLTDLSEFGEAKVLEELLFLLETDVDQTLFELV